MKSVDVLSRDDPVRLADVLSRDDCAVRSTFFP